MPKYLHRKPVNIVKKEKIRLLAFSALTAAMTFVLTMFVKLPIPLTNGGYVHLGDGAVMLAGALLPMPYALASAVVGACLADLMVAPAWIPATFLIKGLTVLCFTSKKETLCCPRNYAAILPSAIICAGGYYLYEALIWGNFIAPLAAVPMSFLQSACGTVLFLAAALSLDRLQFKHRFFGGKI